MNIEHFDSLSLVSIKAGRPETQKPCARLQDAGRASASCDPAMVFRSKMASILSMVRAFYPLSPSRRIAAGHAAEACCLRVKSHAARARIPSTTNVMFFKQSLIARLVLALHVVEQRTPRRHHLQQAAALMIVLHVALEMVGEV